MSGEELSEEIKRMSLTPARFALELGVSRQAVYQWLNGRRPVPAWMRLALIGLEEEIRWERRNR